MPKMHSSLKSSVLPFLGDFPWFEVRCFGKIVAADVKTLYSSLCRDTMNKVFECALEKHSVFNTKAHKIVAELNKICLNKVLTQYGNQLNTQKWNY